MEHIDLSGSWNAQRGFDATDTLSTTLRTLGTVSKILACANYLSQLLRVREVVWKHGMRYPEDPSVEEVSAAPVDFELSAVSFPCSSP
jgi:hypothetical protein